jgi:predicted small metal-binding protein
MQTMTCRQLGGPCELEHRGHTADEVIRAQDRHLRDVVAGGDDSRCDALDAMKVRWRRPVSGMGWYRAIKREFKSLSDG